MKITDVECHVLVVNDLTVDANSSAQDDIVVIVHTDDGISGVGEADTNPWCVQALIKSPGSHNLARGLEEVIVGCDPLEVEALWDKMYIGSFMSGRRGAGICAIGALDMALWDIRGKALGVPCWKLLGGACNDPVIPYASLLPAGETVQAQKRSLVAKVVEAKRLGFRAAKLEVVIMGPYAHNNVRGTYRDVVETVAACREAVGPEMVLMVDVCYSWNDAREALRVINDLVPYKPYFVETPIRLDDLDGYAYLHDHSAIPISAGELQNGRFEFAELMDRGKVDVAQPDVGRVGGLTEAKRVAEMARDRGKLIVPHCWKTAIGIWASVHLAAVTPHCPYIEFLPPSLSESALRRELVLNEPALEDGGIPLPTAPGLGIELNPEALERYKAETHIRFG
jgi:L-alanine-DL-glutamate epimerase-like enolase superfamily enzyme